MQATVSGKNEANDTNKADLLPHQSESGPQNSTVLTRSL